MREEKDSAFNRVTLPLSSTLPEAGYSCRDRF